MNAPALIVEAASVSVEEIFRLRCEARTVLVEACEIDLQSAVDGLQEYAEKSGLIAGIGQDTVQAIMAEAFAKVPRAGELEAAISELADALEAPRPRSGAASSTLKAAEYLVQQNDPKRMREWLKGHSASECAAILHHIQAKGITP